MPRQLNGPPPDPGVRIPPSVRAGFLLGPGAFTTLGVRSACLSGGSLLGAAGSRCGSPSR
jgi:hypothetical protein